MRKEAIMGALRAAGQPLTIGDLSERTGISVPKLRLNLYQLDSTGEVESREIGTERRWTIKVTRSEWPSRGTLVRRQPL